MESVKRKSTKSEKKSVQTEDLIQLVKERRCLWDRTIIGYRDRVAKEKAWTEIYKEIEPDYENYSEEMKNLIGLQITRKWYNVRDSYVKSKKVQNVRHKPYLHSKLLVFLDPIYIDKSYDDTKAEDKSENDENEEQWLNEVFVFDEENHSENGVKRPKLDYNDKNKDVTQDVDDSIVSVLANLINKEDDEDRAFFKSIMPAVKKLSEDTKLEFRIQIMNTLKDLLKKDRHTVSFKCEVVEESDDD